MTKSKSQKIKRVNKETMIVTLDIGKGSHYGYFRAPDGQDVEPFAFYNTYDSFHGFWKKLSRFKKAHGCRQVLVGFESTGPYAEPITHFLKQQPVTLVQINPMHSKRVRELTGNSPNKTDRKDPRVIADVIMLGHALRVVIPQGSSAHLRRLTQARERAIRDRTAIVNQLQHLLFVIFPEFFKVIKKISCKTGLYLLGHYPSPQAIAALGEQQLCRIIKRVSRAKMGQWHAEKLFQAAKASVGINEGQESIVEEIGHLIDKVNSENDFIDRLECQMRSHLQQIPYSRYLLSLPGVGLITVAGLIVGEDIYDTLKNQPLGDYVVLPPRVLNHNGLFIDDWSIEELEEKLCTRIIIFPDSFINLFETISELETGMSENDARALRHTPPLAYLTEKSKGQYLYPD